MLHIATTIFRCWRERNIDAMNFYDYQVQKIVLKRVARAARSFCCARFVNLSSLQIAPRSLQPDNIVS